MKRSLFLSTSVVLLLSVAAPILAATTETISVRLTRRTIRNEAIAQSRIVPIAGVPVSVSESERKAPEQDLSGRSNLSIAARPSRKIAVSPLPPAIVETGRNYVARPTRRSVMENAWHTNFFVPSAPPAPEAN